MDRIRPGRPTTPNRLRQRAGRPRLRRTDAAAVDGDTRARSIPAGDDRPPQRPDTTRIGFTVRLPRNSGSAGRDNPRHGPADHPRTVHDRVFPTGLPPAAARSLLTTSSTTTATSSAVGDRFVIPPHRDRPLDVVSGEPDVPRAQWIIRNDLDADQDGGAGPPDGQPSSRSGQTRRAMTGHGLVAPFGTRSGMTLFNGSPSGQRVSNTCSSCPMLLARPARSLRSLKSRAESAVDR